MTDDLIERIVDAGAIAYHDAASHSTLQPHVGMPQPHPWEECTTKEYFRANVRACLAAALRAGKRYLDKEAQFGERVNGDTLTALADRLEKRP